MENHTNTIKSLFQETGDYIDIKLDLLKLKAVDKSSSIISSVTSVFATLLIVFLFFFILNFGLAFWIGELLGKDYYGFFIVAGFYGIVGIIVYSFRKKIIKTPVSNMVINKLLN